MNTPIKLYHELRKVSPEKARLLVRKVLEQNGGNVSKTARILGISRHTVRRARDGSLKDISRAPIYRTKHLLTLKVSSYMRRSVRYMRLHKYIQGLIYPQIP